MIYLAKPGILAGLSYGRRRPGLGDEWDRIYHDYLGFGGRFELRRRTSAGAHERPERERPIAALPPLPVAEAG